MVCRVGPGSASPVAFNHHAIKRHLAFPAPRHQFGHGVRQISPHAAAETPRLHKHDVTQSGFDQLTIEPGLSELVHDNGGPPRGRVGQNRIQQGDGQLWPPQDPKAIAMVVALWRIISR